MAAVTSDVQAQVTAVAQGMLPDGLDIGERTAAYIVERMPGLGDPAVYPMILESCLANSAGLLDALVRGVAPTTFTPSGEVVASTQAMVRQGLGWPEVMRAYRLGIIYWCERWADGVARHIPNPELAVATVGAGTSFLLTWIDLVTEILAAEFRGEAERLAREQSVARLNAVRSALTDPDLDVHEATLKLGYDLAGDHLAVVVRAVGAGAGAGDAARAFAAAAGAARPLLVQVDDTTAWVWFPCAGAAVRPVPPAGAAVLIGCGRPARGLDGFRRSHREAREALRVAVLGGVPRPGVTHFADVELAALCSADPAALRTFVGEHLGALGGPGAGMGRLRTTLRTFLESGSNFRAAATRLGVHHNTVRYRVEQAEGALGHRVSSDRLALELALRLADVLDGHPAPPGPGH